MPDNFKLHEDAARLLGEVVSEYRRRPKNNPERRRSFGRATPSFYAKITGQHSTEKHRYSWKHLQTQEETEDELLAENEDYAEGDTEENWASEVYRSESVIIGDIVELKAAPEQGFYLFQYCPQVKIARLVSSATITGRQGNTPGNGTVTIEKLEDGTIVDTEATMTVYNHYRATIDKPVGEESKDLYLTIEYSPTDKVWWVATVDCLLDDEETEE